MKRIRGGSGLGDSLYVRPIVDHFIRAGDQVTVMSDWPDVFLDSGATVEAFCRTRIDVLAHYTQGKCTAGTTQWQDICRSAGVAPPLQFDWAIRNHELVERVRNQAAGRPVVLVHGGRAPMGRTDGFGAEMLPAQSAFSAVLESLQDCFLVNIGKGPQLYQLRADLNLVGRTSVADVIDLARDCDAVVGQCSFAIPLAEVFDRPLLVVWGSRGFSSQHQYVRTITPEKVLSKPTSLHVMDDWLDEQLKGTALAFCEFRAGGGAVSREIGRHRRERSGLSG